MNFQVVFASGKDLRQIYGCHTKAVDGVCDFSFSLEKSGSEEFTCHCSHYALTGTCEHLKQVNRYFEFVLTSTGSLEKLDVPRRMIMGDIAIITEKKAYLLSPEIGDISISDVCTLVQTDELSIEAGNLNGARLLYEVGVSYINALFFKSIEVREDSFSAFPKSPLEDFFKLKYEDSEEVLEDLKEASDEEVISGVKISRPKPDIFYVEPDVWKVATASIMNGENVLLLGPAGSGKSELVYLLVEKLDLPLTAFNMGAMSEPRLSLIGATHYNADKGTWFNESRFVRAIQGENGVILLDEITRADRGAFNILLPLLDRQGYIALDEQEDAAVIRKGKRVSFVATANVGMEYTGTEELDRALQDRFSVVIEISWPPEKTEIGILMRRYGVARGVAEKLVSIAGIQRDLAITKGEFTSQVSTRMLLSAARLVSMGMSLAIAFRFAIETQFSDDGGDSSERAMLRQIGQKEGL